MLSAPFRASMRERSCADDQVKPLWSSECCHALDGARAAQHVPALPACAVGSAGAVRDVAYRGLLALASLSWLAAVDSAPECRITICETV